MPLHPSDPHGQASQALFIRLFFRIYQGLWNLAIPLLQRNQRLRQGWDQRLVRHPPGRADLWIQAASVGESLLVREILKTLDPPYRLRILLTTCTSQGFEILEKCTGEVMAQNSRLAIQTAFLPFDSPALMDQALTAVAPRLVLLLESELWPGLLLACKRHQVKILVANGRMTTRSRKRYRIWPRLWRALQPDRILAISPEHGANFAALFGGDKVEIVPNIKFDRIDDGQCPTGAQNPLARLLPPDAHLIVLGSIREEEEADVEKMIRTILQRSRQERWPVIVALFPRHMHRVERWETTLEKLGYPWYVRSRLTGPAATGSIILWNTMGELLPACGIARAAFIGGSLAPSGGQNFLEPLTCGLRPVIGPHWHNFSWIGREIIDQGLVFQVKDWQEAAKLLLAHSRLQPRREQTRQETLTYVEGRRGGTSRTCATIHQLLRESTTTRNQP